MSIRRVLVSATVLLGFTTLAHAEGAWREALREKWKGDVR